MDEPVSAADANRNFSLILRGVREGRTYVVTNHGKAVARILPAERDEAVSAAARKALLEHLQAQPVLDVGRWTRDELYERDR
ncbi:prevent-host-death family protein [Stella humosa]|uniref:Antitoxin n=1 Tax=Stella humosa TaxID=94 RepID=A0A3N1KX60_9PROT|nr:type II toxin-antitoxin system prevent-host-death family antitoxin [Stella humosa]ROP83359.1 prevent-host-death family protein [Stella humosa]BBK29857.1 antitoxin [Stella humosa]